MTDTAASQDLETAHPAEDNIDDLFSALTGNFPSSPDHKKASAELSGRIFSPQVAGRIVQIILTGLLLNIRLTNEPDTISDFKAGLKCAGHTAGEILRELDVLFYRPLALKETLLEFCLSLDSEKLTFLAEQVKLPLGKFSAEEQALLLTLRDTPAWLCKAISGASAFCGLLSTLVAVPYRISAGREALVTAEMETASWQTADTLVLQLTAFIYWLDRRNCAPPSIDMVPCNIQEAVAAAVKERLLKTLPRDTLQALSGSPFLPAWLRAVAAKLLKDRRPKTSGLLLL